MALSLRNSVKGAVERSSRGCEIVRYANFRYATPWAAGAAKAWLERIDPGTHRRIKGLRLVTAFAIAWMMANLPGLFPQLPGRAALGVMAAGFALWASVSEGRTTRGLPAEIWRCCAVLVIHENRGLEGE